MPVNGGLSWRASGAASKEDDQRQSTFNWHGCWEDGNAAIRQGWIHTRKIVARQCTYSNWNTDRAQCTSIQSTLKSNQVCHHSDAHDSFLFCKRHRGSDILCPLPVDPQYQRPDDREPQKVWDSISTCEIFLERFVHVVFCCLQLLLILCVRIL